MKFAPIKFSIIMPTFNRRHFVSRAIKSVSDQDCIDRSTIEILVVDDGSTDGTYNEATSIDVSPCNLRVFKIEHIGEPGTVRNYALEKANGEFLAYCDSDDYWLPHHLATAVQEFDKDPKLEMVSNFWGLAHFVVLDNGIIKNRIIVPPHSPSTVNTNCRVHRRSCLKRVGNFNRSRWGEDIDFFQRIERKFKTSKTMVITSINGYIKDGNNISYDSDQGIKNKYR